MAATDAEKIRFLLGADPLYPSDSIVTDAQIRIALELQSNFYKAAALIAHNLSLQFIDNKVSIDGLTVDGTEAAEYYRTLAKKLEAGGADGSGALGGPIVSGVSIGEIASVNSDSDRMPDRFTIGQDDFLRR